jgi:ribonuclease J
MLKVTPLGGLGQVGLNAMVLEHGAERVLVDCGVLFPRPDQLGIDVVVPDFTALRDDPERLKAVVLTHAHEDHLGALPVLLREFQVPVYGTPFTLALARHRLEEAGLTGDLREIGPGEAFSASGAFTIEPVQVTHSVPDAVGLWVKTPSATLVHSGDFKLDLSPIDGKLTDLSRLGTLGEQGVDLLLSDSTNAENDGWTPSETLVKETFARLFHGVTGRIVVAQFGSHLHRVQHLVRLAPQLGRQVVLSGRSLVRNAELARTVGRLEIPPGLLISLDAASSSRPARRPRRARASHGSPRTSRAPCASSRATSASSRPAPFPATSPTSRCW